METQKKLTQEQIQKRIDEARAIAAARAKAIAAKKEYRKRFCETTQADYNIVYNHFRYDKHGKIRRFMRGVSRWRPTMYGGLTVCVAVHKVTGRILTGYGNCDPADRFTYADGRWYAWGNVYEFIQFEKLNDKGQRHGR